MKHQSLKQLQEGITKAMEEIYKQLKGENPTLALSSQHADHQLTWILQWKRTDNSEEYFEVEIWQDQAKYSIMGTHRKDEFTEVSGVEYFCFEGMSQSELLSAYPKLIEEIKTSITSAIFDE